MSKEIVSFGNDFVVEYVDRGYGGARKTIVSVSGADGSAVVGNMAIDKSGNPSMPKIAATASAALGGLLALGTEGVQALTGAGAVDVTHFITMLTTSGVAQALTIADGTVKGQMKLVHHTVDGGSAVLTPTHAGNFATFTFTNVHDACLLRWNGTAWDILLNVGGTIA